ncbi:MAG: hypothetical protein GX216_05475 [Methanomicrobiales archaeon]|nr:hypothetical protein [Methanomicrobiales archaeon]
MKAVQSLEGGTFVVEPADYGIPCATVLKIARTAVMAIDVIRREEITIEPLAHYRDLT